MTDQPPADEGVTTPGPSPMDWWQTPPGPVGPTADEHPVPPTAVPSRRRRPVGIFAVTAAVVLALVGGVVAVTALTGPGANTPDEAVRGLLTAAGNADVLGVLDHIDPAERAAVTGFLTNGAQDLQRLGVLGPGLDLHHITGLSAAFQNVQTQTADLRPGLAAVTITGGSVHVHLDQSQLPLGQFVRQHAGSALANIGVKDTSTAAHPTEAIVTVRRGDTWYVSLGYTLAEVARHSAKLAAPGPSAAVPAIGAASPVAAVDAFVHALAAMNVERLIELTPPDEMGALHDYAPLFLPRLNSALSRAHPFSITITALDLASQDHPGGKLVTIKSIGLHASFGGTTIDLSPGSKCPTVTGGTTSFDFSRLCGNPAAGSPLPPGWSGAFDELKGIHADVGFVTVERGGSWYVSPTRTVLDDIESFLHAVPSDFLTKLVGLFNPSTIIRGGISNVTSTGSTIGS